MRDLCIAFNPIVRPLFLDASMGLWEERLKTPKNLKMDYQLLEANPQENNELVLWPV